MKTKSSLDLLRDMADELNAKEAKQEEYVQKLEKVLRRCVGEQCAHVIRVMQEEGLELPEAEVEGS
tara:strand:- start:51 stop:248 length:198 start_codon:yes stop_codon:yes gene_type:complete